MLCYEINSCLAFQPISRRLFLDTRRSGVSGKDSGDHNLQPLTIWGLDFGAFISKSTRRLWQNPGIQGRSRTSSDPWVGNLRNAAMSHRAVTAQAITTEGECVNATARLAPALGQDMTRSCGDMRLSEVCLWRWNSQGQSVVNKASRVRVLRGKVPARDCLPRSSGTYLNSGPRIPNAALAARRAGTGTKM